MGTIYLDGICYSSGGGGGASSADQVSLDDANLAYVADDVQEAFEKVTRSLTYAEYAALTGEEKNNGTIYLITDVNGDGQSFQPVIYSEEEREIGVWTDGKPLYEKTVHISDLDYTTAATYKELCILSNVDNIVNISGKLTNSAQTVQYSIPYISSKFATVVFENSAVHGNVNALLFYSDDIWADAMLYVTIRYTKTTDAPGSGKWTPQGIPAVHYSTEEQVIGTWVDGSTLYQKTINVGTISSDTIVAHGIANLDTIIDYSGFGVYGSADKAVMPFQNPANSTGFGLNYYDATNLYLKKSSGLGSNFSGCYLTIRYTKTST